MFEMMRSPVRIGHIEIPNRVVMPAMGVNLSAPGGGVSDDVIAFYEARARGGAGLIISEITRVVDGAGAGEPCQLAARGALDIPGLCRLADAVHKYDTKLFLQLHHPGRQAMPFVTGTQPVAPSAIAGDNGVVPRELSTQECEELVRAFATGALVAKMAGADGVELHGAHGYLINGFLSGAMNHRSDKYGAGFEGRMRFVCEIIESIRQICGARFPISVRINAEEALPGGIDIAQATDIARVLERAGADAINASCYTHECIEPGTYPQGGKKRLAAAIKAAVSIPVIAVCNIKQPEIGEALLCEGVCDLIGIGRGQLADPDWFLKTISGRLDEIRPCIGCLACFEEICNLRRVKCAVNPVAGREREYAHAVRDGDGRRVVIIGGGPAGIEAALVLKGRGFAPVIFEKADRLGGALNIADKGYGKSLITLYVASLAARVRASGIEVRLGSEESPDDISALNPSAVFVACGAEPFVPDIPGIAGPNVVTAEDVLTGAANPTGRVAVIGSGMTGLETAEMLAGGGCAVTLVEMLDAVGPGMYPALVEDVMNRIKPFNPRVLTGHRLTQIAREHIVVTRISDGQEVKAFVQWVVLAMGVRPRAQTLGAFRAAFDNVFAIGDANRCGRILEATKDAHARAFVFRQSL